MRVSVVSIMISKDEKIARLVESPMLRTLSISLDYINHQEEVMLQSSISNDRDVFHDELLFNALISEIMWINNELSPPFWDHCVPL